jgi:hypothetical protein
MLYTVPASTSKSGRGSAIKIGGPLFITSKVKGTVRDDLRTVEMPIIACERVAFNNRS